MAAMAPAWPSPATPERPDRSRRRYGASAVVSVHAVHGCCRKPGDVARQHRSRDLRPGGWDLDVPPEAIGAADERPFRDGLGQDAFRVTRVPRYWMRSASPWVTV